MNRPEFSSVSRADTSISVPDPDTAKDGLTEEQLAELRLEPTKDQIAELNADIDAMYQNARNIDYGRIGFFKLTHTLRRSKPTASDWKSLMESMPSPMRPHIIRATKLLALHPQEGERIEGRISTMIGFSLRKEKNVVGSEPDDDIINAEERAWRLKELRELASNFLTECGEQDQKFSEELKMIILAEQRIGMNSQQIVQLDK